MLKRLLMTAVSLFMTPEAFAATHTVPTVIDAIEAHLDNAGINPDAFAFRITADVLVGSNPCRAEGVSVKLIKSVEDRVIVITPVKKEARPSAICGADFDPVYKRVTIIVRGYNSQVDDVVVRNIGGIGNETNLNDFLED